MWGNNYSAITVPLQDGIEGHVDPRLKPPERLIWGIAFIADFQGPDATLDFMLSDQFSPLSLPELRCVSMSRLHRRQSN